MRVFKYKTFIKWAKKQRISDGDLKKAIIETQKGLMDANLGGHVYKKRIGVQGRGKRGAYRTILLMKVGDTAIFAHGFTKGDIGNITKNELEAFKTMAEAFLNLSDKQLVALTKKQSLIEVFLNE
ncbi:MAG: toxin [Methyloprofundus sp.]|nr:MAG: toxin [Methyloprofundus sp.]